MPDSDRTSDVPSLRRRSGLCRPYLRLRRARFQPRPRVGNVVFPGQGRLPPTSSPFGAHSHRTKTFRPSSDPNAGALHPRLSLRARWFRLECGFVLAAPASPPDAACRFLQHSTTRGHDPRFSGPLTPPFYREVSSGDALPRKRAGREPPTEVAALTRTEPRLGSHPGRSSSPTCPRVVVGSTTSSDHEGPDSASR